ncbi:MAG: chromosome segregation protein SMC [Gemmatimonadales bacterium]|nr:chromosome segregation protein SMC [Gemmatimonadales bacterium]
MKLVKLELSGFKSFADTVTLHFDAGVTAIVGPNGCGKSNVSDAVRWVLGEQSARLLRGGKMEDVIFQGAANRKPVNVTEVSLYLDNADGDLPIAYQEVVITRRLSRSGQSDYLLNHAPVRLRDIQDLLRGTGLGSDAGVVIEAEMIKLLLSDRADERRSLFEEAAGISLYRDRKHSTERRLDETQQDLQRVEDLIAEVQSQLRSLARQKGRAERHVKLSEEKFALQLSLARRQLERLALEVEGMTARFGELGELVPARRQQLAEAEQRRESTGRARAGAEGERTEVATRLGAVRVELGRLEGDLALAAERLTNAGQRRLRAADERAQMEARAAQAVRELEAAGVERSDADAEAARIASELSTRAEGEEAVRRQLVEQRESVRRLEQEAQADLQATASLESERNALEHELVGLRERVEQALAQGTALRRESDEARRRHGELSEQAERRVFDARQAATALEAARHHLAEVREREAHDRATRRQAEESLAQLTARRQALEELERERVGLAPAAAALLGVRDRFGGAVLGPLSDFLAATRDEAELAERLLGDWMHAVLVRDLDALPAIKAWHEETQPGAIVLLPASPGPRIGGDVHPVAHRLRAEGPAAAWVQAALAGSEVLDDRGHLLRRASGAVFLPGAQGQSGPLRRRAELAALGQDVGEAEQRFRAAEAAVAATVALLQSAEAALTGADSNAEAARAAERQAIATRDDAARAVAALEREATAAEQQLERVRERLAADERRVAEIDVRLEELGVARARRGEALGTARTALQALEAEQESAREQRVHWQVQAAHVNARVQAALERMQRTEALRDDALRATDALGVELAELDATTAALEAQRLEWQGARDERRVARLELEAAATDAERALAEADAALAEAEQRLAAVRHETESLTEESHGLQVALTEAAARRRSLVERVEAEWRRPFEQLLEGFTPLDLDFETLEAEAARVTEQLESLGPVNPLAVEEHAEEARRLEFLQAQRDDLVGARQSLLQAIREIDGTARALFLETFTAVRGHFLTVFQTLFGGGECDLRLADPDDPLESEIEIHAAPRGKKTQRIHLLSSGERALVAVSLLFSIYLTKPSPFCLMDEVDAPLDDANVGRFTQLLTEFKHSTQFIVITHNPRTMQAADAVYGVTMQEPGVSTIVGVRLGEKVGA